MHAKPDKCTTLVVQQEEYVSSSESELGEEDRAFAEDMGLPTGDADLLDSEHSSDDEDVGAKGGKASKSKTAKAKADAAAAVAARAAENSWVGGAGGAGGGGRWGAGGGGGRDVKVEEEHGNEKAATNHEVGCHDEAVASDAVLVPEGRGDEVISDEDERRGDAVVDDGEGQAADSCARAETTGETPAAVAEVPRSSRVTGVWDAAKRFRAKKSGHDQEEQQPSEMCS